MGTPVFAEGPYGAFTALQRTREATLLVAGGVGVTPIRALLEKATAVACPECGQPAERVHPYHQRRLADIPVGGRGVIVELPVRRLVCQTPGCQRRTFRELADEPGVAVTRLLAEIRDLGYPGSANLLVRYLKQGRADAERAPPAPRRLVCWLMTKPDNLPAHQRSHLNDLLATCPHLTALADRVREFAGLLTNRGHDLDA